MPDIDDDGGGIDPMMSITSIDVDGNSGYNETSMLYLDKYSRVKAAKAATSALPGDKTKTRAGQLG